MHESGRELKNKMKKIAVLVLAVIAIVAVSSLSLAVNTANAKTDQSNLLGVANRPVQKSWIRINGYINQWGTTDVKGVLQTQARTALLETSDTRQLASATAIWTTNNSRPISSVKTKENFTYTFYVARLANASVSTLSTSSENSNYLLTGTWNIYTINSNVTITTNEDNEITRVHRDSDTTVSQAYGELNVTDNWTKFQLSINGIDPLTGSVFRSMTRQVAFNPFKIIDETSSKTSRADLAEVFKCYHAMPGWGSYDSRMDFNNNYKIDIADLSTVAANM